MDKQTRQILAFHVGDRSQASAKQLWARIPTMYRECATFYTDRYAAYTGVLPPAQHKAITKSARKTNHIERFNNTLHCDSGSHGWCAARWHSPRNWRIISAPSAISSPTTISEERHYLYNTSGERRGPLDLSGISDL